MDPLTQQLMQRQLGPPQQGAPSDLPVAPPPGQPPQGAMPPGAMPPGAPPPGAGGPPQIPPENAGVWGPMMGEGSISSLLQPRPAPPPGGPAVPPNPATKTPPQANRFNNAQQIQDAYRNNWQPNPVLLRAQLGNR